MSDNYETEKSYIKSGKINAMMDRRYAVKKR